MSSRGLLFLIPVALAAIVCAQDPMGIFPRTEDLHGLWKNVTPKDLPFKHELQPGGACSVSLSGQVSGSYQSTSGKTFLITAGPAQSSPIWEWKAESDGDLLKIHFLNDDSACEFHRAGISGGQSAGIVGAWKSQSCKIATLGARYTEYLLGSDAEYTFGQDNRIQGHFAVNSEGNIQLKNEP